MNNPKENEETEEQIVEEEPITFRYLSEEESARRREGWARRKEAERQRRHGRSRDHVQCKDIVSVQHCWNAPNCKYVCGDPNCTAGSCTETPDKGRKRKAWKEYQEHFCQKGTKMNISKCPYQEFPCYDGNRCWPRGETEDVQGIASVDSDFLSLFKPRSRKEWAEIWTEDWADDWPQEPKKEKKKELSVSVADDNPCVDEFRPITRGIDTDDDPDAYCSHLKDRPCYVRSVKGHTCCYSKKSVECIQNQNKEQKDLQKKHDRFYGLWNIIESAEHKGDLSPAFFTFLQNRYNDIAQNYNNIIQEEGRTMRYKIAKQGKELEKGYDRLWNILMEQIASLPREFVRFLQFYNKPKLTHKYSSGSPRG